MGNRIIILLFFGLFFSCQKHEKQVMFVDYKNKVLEIKQPSDFVFDSISIVDETGLKYNFSLVNKLNGSPFINLKKNNAQDYEIYLNSIDSLSCKSEISIVLRRKGYGNKVTLDEASNFKYNKNVIVVDMYIFNHCLKDFDTIYSVPFRR